MSDLKQMLAEEAEYGEEHKDAEPGPDTKVSRPNRARSHVFSVRLSDDEMRRLAEAAERAGVGASTYARSLITKQLAGERPLDDQEVREALATVLRLAPAMEAMLRAEATLGAPAGDRTAPGGMEAHATFGPTSSLRGEVPVYEEVLTSVESVEVPPVDIDRPTVPRP